MLYTIVPVEEIFGEDDEERTFVTATVTGCSLLVEPLGDGRGRVERILSTDPAHYLNARVQPGSVVSLV